MKIQSELYPEVFFEKWKTPVSNLKYHHLSLFKTLQSPIGIHFFFEAYGNRGNYVVTIPYSSPFQVVDEWIGYLCTGKHLKPKDANQKKNAAILGDLTPTFKFWNTKFTREARLDQTISSNNMNLCEYWIKTADHSITFVSSEAPKWEVHDNVDSNQFFLEYVKRIYLKQ